jgi:hypothetical protein
MAANESYTDQTVRSCVGCVTLLILIPILMMARTCIDDRPTRAVTTRAQAATTPAPQKRATPATSTERAQPATTKKPAASDAKRQAKLKPKSKGT